MSRKALIAFPLSAFALALAACGGGSSNSTPPAAVVPPAATVSAQDALATTTPIKHVVVIYGENQSFDHYFGTYPNALNPAGEPAFTAAAGTPAVNGLTPALLNANPNSTNASNLAIPLTAAQLEPFRIDRSQANTGSQNHSYTPEQLAEDNGAMDAFPANTGQPFSGGTGVFATKGIVMGYFDGNTDTALWNYAQHFAMSDNAYTGTYGPSTPGAIEVISGQNNGIILSNNSTGAVTQGGSPSPSTNAIPDGQGGFTLIGDLDPTGDACTVFHDTTANTITGQFSPANQNIGDLLNAKNITWGGFMGGFNLSTVNANSTTGCGRSTYSPVLNLAEVDYTQHHAWFQYYPTTANLTHARPTSTALIGATDPLDSTATPVHHQYDTDDFFAAVTAGNFPSVAFLKAPAVQDAHPGNSDPLDEQAFVTKVVNFLEQQPDWKNTAVIVAYDDSDGWYDHQFAAPTSSSFDATSVTDTGHTGADQLTAPGSCTSAGAVQPVGVGGAVVNGRCGPGTRTPFIVISPWANANFVSHTLITQASVTRFIEDNWLGGQRIGKGSFDATAGSINNMFNFAGSGNLPPLFLDNSLGTVLSAAPTTVTN